MSDRAILYARVSTSDKGTKRDGQIDSDDQIDLCRKYADDETRTTKCL